VYHVINRRVMRMPLFEKDGDYEAFGRVLAMSLERPDAPSLLAFCLMPSHWHLIVQARRSTNLSTWMQWVSVTHTHRWHAHRHAAGEGPLYQGRFKSFPVQEDAHFLTVCRYVEANAVRAGLADAAQDWPWSSLWFRQHPRAELYSRLRPWPVDRPRNWLLEVNRPMDEDALKAVRESLVRGLPLGDPSWRIRMATRLELQTTLRPRGRPRKTPEKSS
jgi:putative transposase